MKCKRALMGLAALVILGFHFWMPLTTSAIENNIYRSTYWGVDIFFLLSAHSLESMKQISVGKFLANRLRKVYLPFAIMAVICAIYKKWTIGRLALVLCGAEFFQRGGGSFLWFAPAIMIMYIMAPMLIKWREGLGWKFAPIALAAWLVCVCVLQFGLKYTTIFILLNRFPIFIIGLYYNDIRKFFSLKLSRWIWAAGLVIGSIILLKFCGNVRLSKPITEIYYLLVIPFTLSLVLLVDDLTAEKEAVKGPLSFLGGITLELYGLQMIFGYDIETGIFKLIRTWTVPLSSIKLITFISTAIALIVIAWLFSLSEKGVERLTMKGDRR